MMTQGGPTQLRPATQRAGSILGGRLNTAASAASSSSAAHFEPVRTVSESSATAAIVPAEFELLYETSDDLHFTCPKTEEMLVV
jgi:hypothetical protein